jgi:DNA polymerase elongation subunit (family B)
MNTTVIDKHKIQKLLGALNRNDIKFYQFYNLELSADEYQFQEYMTNFHEGDATKKVLNKSYYDIEVKYDPAVFPDAERAAYMINAIAVYNNIKNEATIFTIPTGCNEENQEILEKEVNNLYEKLGRENATYKIKDIKIYVKTFKSESELLKTFFTYVREINSLFLIGFNSSLFDDPYVVNRGVGLIGHDIYNYISEFGEVSKFGERTYDWPDYIKVDILNLYKPVDQGGSGFGQSLPNFKLNTVAKEELGITKLDLEDMNWEYENNIVRFLTYNLFDTLLTFKLDEKLQFLELNWMLAKYNTAPMSSAINGRSIMYKYRNNLIYTKRNEIIRSKIFGREIFYPIELKEEYG